MFIKVGILTAPRIDWEQTDDGFVIHHVRIGIGFHWDREEDQTFQGELSILHNADGTQTAVNTIDLEDYLCSVISSEMNANAPMELLKAHAVISRSWAIRAIEANRHRTPSTTYESNGHIGFDVCADDHCQRYEGTRRINARAIEAVRATTGQVLTYSTFGTDGTPSTFRTPSTHEICDCRFHKCCGGRTEEFETCWEDKHVPYLISVECPYCNPARPLTPNRSPFPANRSPFPANPLPLKHALNDYDWETQDYHDWTVHYTREELSAIVAQKTGIEWGEITDLIPIKRGQSGRIYALEIVGTQHREVIGKELKIRRTLSRSCLYSSWFDVTKTDDGFTLMGHGWGHGVGLCQIGATVLAIEGKTYQDILNHYYPHTIITPHTTISTPI